MSNVANRPLPETAEGFLNQANYYLARKGREADAIALLKAGTAKFYEDPALWKLLGNAIAESDPTEAVQCFMNGWALEEGVTDLDSALKAIKDPAQQANLLRQCTAAYPDDAALWEKLGYSVAQSDPREAAECFKNVWLLAADPTTSMAMNIAIAMNTAGDYEGAEKVCLDQFHADAAASSRSLTLTVLGEIYLATDQKGYAVACFSNAASLDPGNTQAITRSAQLRAEGVRNRERHWIAVMAKAQARAPGTA